MSRCLNLYRMSHHKLHYNFVLDFAEWAPKLMHALDIKRNQQHSGIIFVLDESISISNNQFEIQMKFVATVAKLFP